MASPSAMWVASCTPPDYVRGRGRGPALASGEQHAVPGRIRGEDTGLGALRVGARLRQAVGGAVAFRRAREDELEVVQPQRTLGRHGRALALPGVEPEMMVVAAGREEERAGIGAHHHVEAERAVVEALVRRKL